MKGPIFDIKEKARSLPSSPGIYLFLNEQSEIIYIGKAKSLKHRVGSYFQKQDSLDFKTQALVEEIHDLDYIPTKTEEEALLLEAQLVKEKQPRFNILLKEGQPFIYFVITNTEVPEFLIVRNKKKKGSYWGPFINKSQARMVHKFLTQRFNVQLCSKKIPNGCLFYHMNRCAGNCKDQFDVNDYTMRVELIRKLLNNKYDEYKQEILYKIEEYNSQFLFEKSQQLHQYLESLEYIKSIVCLNFNPRKFSPLLSLVGKQSQLAPNKQVAQELKKEFGLSLAPETIDCFDISHFQSHGLVGSCVRFVNGLPEKNMFRRFKIKTLDEQNDYAALQEIVNRRYRNKNFPDLVLIDGGKGQLNAVKDLFPQLEFISIAKREERIFSETYPQGKVLDPHSESGKLLMALRDYAHHFAVSYHRKRRQKEFKDTM